MAALDWTAEVVDAPLEVSGEELCEDAALETGVDTADDAA
jgi:hypothetical protein